MLNQILIESGEKIIKKLDEKKVRVTAALWYYFEDIESWKLMMFLPDEIVSGPKHTYGIIQDAYKESIKKNEIDFSDVVLIKPKSPLIEVLKIAIKTDKNINHIRFSNNIINGELIRDAFIYRLL